MTSITNLVMSKSAKGGADRAVEFAVHLKFDKNSTVLSLKYQMDVKLEIPMYRICIHHPDTDEELSNATCVFDLVAHKSCFATCCRFRAQHEVDGPEHMRMAQGACVCGTSFRMDLQGDEKEVLSEQSQDEYDLLKKAEAEREHTRELCDDGDRVHNVKITGPCGNPYDVSEVLHMFKKQDETDGAAGIDRIAARVRDNDWAGLTKLVNVRSPCLVSFYA